MAEESDGELTRKSWFVLHVKPRTEKKVMLYLARYGCFRYLPLVLKVTKVQRRKVRRTIPVFPGYVFSRMTPEERIEMLKTNLIVSAICVTRPREMIHQLRQVAHASRGDTSMMPVSMCKVGDYVRVVSGPMRGMEGYIQRKGREASLCLNVEILGAAVEVSVAPFDIEIINR